MKKIRKLLPMLVAMLFLLMPAIRVEAENYVEVKSGSKTAKVTFTASGILALEGTVSTGSKTGFKPVSIQVTGTAEGSMTKYSPEGDQFVVIGGSIPADPKITVNLESSSPMKDGKYAVKLKWGKTDVNGEYSKGEKKAYIYVGIEPDEESEEDEDSDSTDTERTTTSTNTPEPEEAETITEVDSDRAGMVGMVDYSALKAALDEAEALKTSELSKHQLERLLNAIENGNKAMNSTTQEEVDAAVAELDEVLTEIRGENSKEGVPLKKSGGGLPFGKIWPVLLAILLMIILGVVIWYLWRKKRQAEEDYDGAPLVDYDISEDDEE